MSAAETKTATQVLRELKRASRWRQAAEEKLAEQRVVQHDLVVAAYEAGVPKAQIAEAAGLTRPSIYLILAKAGVDA